MASQRVTGKSSTDDEDFENFQSADFETQGSY
jgi:hypothetical protein